MVPVRNEAENIEPLMTEISTALDGRCDYEIIYVDDGSDDDTLPRLRALCQRFPRLRILHHDGRRGQSAALLSGVQAARSPWIVTLDGDGQNDPADISRLLPFTKRYSTQRKLLVIGNRTSRQDNGWRRFSSRVANGVRGRILMDHTPDTGCGLKLFPRQLFLMLPYFDHMHRFLPALVQRQGGISMSVEVHHRPRAHGHSKYGTLDRLGAGIIDMMGVMWLQRRASLPAVVEERRGENNSHEQ